MLGSAQVVFGGPRRSLEVLRWFSVVFEGPHVAFLNLQVSVGNPQVSAGGPDGRLECLRVVICLYSPCGSLSSLSKSSYMLKPFWAPVGALKLSWVSSWSSDSLCVPLFGVPVGPQLDAWKSTHVLKWSFRAIGASQVAFGYFLQCSDGLWGSGSGFCWV